MIEFLVFTKDEIEKAEKALEIGFILTYKKGVIMTKNILVCTSSMMAIVFGAAGSAAAQNHVQHNQMNNAACVLGSGNAGTCSGPMRVVEEIQIQTTGAPVSYSAPSNTQMRTSCDTSIAQRVPCDGQWVRSNAGSHSNIAHAHHNHSASGAHPHGGSGHATHGGGVYNNGSSHGGSVAYNGAGYGSNGYGNAGYGNNSGNYATGPLKSIPTGYEGNMGSGAAYIQGGPSGNYALNGAGYGSGYGSSYYSSGSASGSSYSSSSVSTNTSDTGYFVAGQPGAPVYSAPAPSMPMQPMPMQSAPAYAAPSYQSPMQPMPMYPNTPSYTSSGYSTSSYTTYGAPNNYVNAPMPIDGISPVFFYGGNMGGVGANVHGGYGGGGGSYYSGGSRFSGIANYTRLTPPGPKGRPNPPPPPPPPN